MLNKNTYKSLQYELYRDDPAYSQRVGDVIAQRLVLMQLYKLIYDLQLFLTGAFE